MLSAIVSQPEPPDPSQTINAAHINSNDSSIPAISLLGVCLVLCCLASPAAAEGGLLDEASGHWQGDYNSNDSFGNYHGVIIGAGDYAPAKIDQGFLFNSEGYLELPLAGVLSATSFTFHMWVKAELADSMFAPIFYLGHSRGETSVTISDDGSLCARIEWRHGGCSFSTGSSTFKDGELAHLTIVKDGGRMRLFKNGVLVGAGSGSCCLDVQSQVRIGGSSIRSRGVDVLIDEIYYYDFPLSDEAVFATYNEFIINNPDPALMAELEEAYAQIDALQLQVEQLTQSNFELEDQVTALEQKNVVYASEVFALESQIDDLESEIHELEDNVLELETNVGQLESELTDLREQVLILKDLVKDLETQVRYLEQQVDALQLELNNLKELLITSLSRLEEDFRITFHNPNFAIPGESSEAKLENLIDAIIGLNKGRKMGIYKALGGHQQRFNILRHLQWLFWHHAHHRADAWSRRQ